MDSMQHFTYPRGYQEVRLTSAVLSLASGRR
jgi:hypothetical protein